jgi:hypothetical protein
VRFVNTESAVDGAVISQPIISIKIRPNFCVF